MQFFKSRFGSFVILGGFIGWSSLLHAQVSADLATAAPVEVAPLALMPSDIATFSSLSEAQLAALISGLDATPALAMQALPGQGAAGTFWSLQNPDSAPLPFDSSGSAVWPMSDGSFLLNDVNYDYHAAHQQSLSARAGRAMSLDPNDPGNDSGTNVYTPNDFIEPDYGTNLFLVIHPVANQVADLLISNTQPGVLYEIQSFTNLASANWVSAGWVYGSAATNWTPASVVATNDPALFFQVRSWAADGSGLPLWWQEQYFGGTGIDPYGNPAGDGWNNLQKFQNGWDPNVFYTPPAPQGLTVNYNANNGTAKISWLPSPGPVTGYTLETPNGNFEVAAGTQTFEDANLPGIDLDQSYYSGPTIYGNYYIYAHYPNGNSALSGPVPLEPDPLFFYLEIINFVAGPQGTAYLAARSFPAGTQAVRLTRYDEYAEDYGWDFSSGTSLEFPVASFTNGLCLLPASVAFPPPDAYGQVYYYWWVQLVYSNGAVSQAQTWSGYPYRGFSFQLETSDGFLYYPVPPYFDGRQQLKENLVFQLRAATVTSPFHFIDHYSTHDISYPSPSNYVASGFFQFYGNSYFDGFDALAVFNKNARYRNFVLAASQLNGYGQLTTGATGNYEDANGNYAPASALVLNEPATFQFEIPNAGGATIPALLATNDTQWLGTYPSNSRDDYLAEIGVTNNGAGAYVMASNARNWFGLPLLSAKVCNPAGTSILSAGGSTTQDGHFYPETAQPQLQTVAYEFWDASWENFNSVPGGPNFSPTNRPPLLMTAVGNQYFQVAGYAKLAVLNGYSGVDGYLGQYFEGAYQITNGVVTTNATGVLSPYGYFFATEPGPAALVTMPDLDTGERGTGTVHCVSLMVDKNHDGIMDTSFNGADTTSQANPMVCWVNNGRTVAGTGGNQDEDLFFPPNHPEFVNYAQGKVTCQRDLENFFRLWICGVPQLPSSQGYTLTLSLTATSGNPAINLYSSSDAAGGTGYLTDTNVAADQARTYLSPNPEFGVSLATINAQQSYALPANFFDFNYPYRSRFLFEGAGIGSGQLTLTISQNGNVLCESSVWLDLHDVKDLYEQAHIDGLLKAYPSMVNSTNVSTFASDHPLANNPSESSQLVVLVHGWRMGVGDYQSFSDTMFKRLYWQGFHGRFASLRWPTLSTDDFKHFSTLQAYLTYNASEYIAFRSAQGASDYFDWLKSRFPDYSISVAAHSMGNIVMMETLKLQLALGHHDIDNYVLMQAAVPAHCYDVNAPFQPSLVTEEIAHPTPNTYLEYPGALANAINGTMVNFFNTNDYALNFWIGNQDLNKPDGSYGYYIVPAVQPYKLPNTLVTDPREIMAFVARPRSYAVGAQTDVQGLISEQGQVDLLEQFGFTDASTDHSGQFNRNIQNTAPFYQTLLNSLFPL